MTEIEHYKAAYKQEKLRADLLQADLDRVDDLHAEELEKIKNEQ